MSTDAEAPPRAVPFKNGDVVDGVGGWCDLCSVTFGGSATIRRAKYLDGKFYHLHPCYSAAVQMYLADQYLAAKVRGEAGGV